MTVRLGSRPPQAQIVAHSWLAAFTKLRPASHSRETNGSCVRLVACALRYLLPVVPVAEAKNARIARAGRGTKRKPHGWQLRAPGRAGGRSRATRSASSVEAPATHESARAMHTCSYRSRILTGSLYGLREATLLTAPISLYRAIRRAEVRYSLRADVRAPRKHRTCTHPIPHTHDT